jgi:nucleotide-binding universal stress UspA family protein
VRPELEVRVGNPVKEILLAGHDRDLVVLVAHRKSLLGDLVLGATVERVLRHSRIPVLAIPSGRN